MALAVAVPPGPCGDVQETSFVCGADHPEDLALVPGTHWVVASGFASGAGIKLVDTRKRTLRRWYTGATSQVSHDTSAFPHCPGPPDATALNAQGMSLRRINDQSTLLYVS